MKMTHRLGRWLWFHSRWTVNQKEESYCYNVMYQEAADAMKEPYPQAVRDCYDYLDYRRRHLTRFENRNGIGLIFFGLVALGTVGAVTLIVFLLYGGKVGADMFSTVAIISVGAILIEISVRALHYRNVGYHLRHMENILDAFASKWPGLLEKIEQNLEEGIYEIPTEWSDESSTLARKTMEEDDEDIRVHLAETVQAMIAEKAIERQLETVTTNEVVTATAEPVFIEPEEVELEEFTFSDEVIEEEDDDDEEDEEMSALMEKLHAVVGRL